MKKLTLALVAAASVWAWPSAQAPPAANAALRQQIERRFEVLLLTDRVVLRPRSASGAVRLVELGGTGAIAIDGAPATGAEVRDKLGADADAVIQLSYLDMAQRRELFGGRRRRASFQSHPASHPRTVYCPDSAGAAASRRG